MASTINSVNSYINIFLPQELLEDRTIYKVGVAPDDDGRYLYQDYNIALKGTLDVRHIARLCGHKPGGLGALSQSLLGIMLDKSWRVSSNNWKLIMVEL